MQVVLEPNPHPRKARDECSSVFRTPHFIEIILRVVTNLEEMFRAAYGVEYSFKLIIN